ncbi:hypothetical protein FHT09_001631 [Xanthomonas arboricola]|nr:hypothetical protein [Xanthomonas sp. CFBP 8152]
MSKCGERPLGGERSGFIGRTLGCSQKPGWSCARCPHRSRDTPQVRPCRLGGGIHAATRSRNRRGHRTRKCVGCLVERLLVALLVMERLLDAPFSEQCTPCPVCPCTPTISTGPCPLTVAGPYAAWMSRKSLQGRTCGVSRDGGRARALQPSRNSATCHGPASNHCAHRRSGAQVPSQRWPSGASSPPIGKSLRRLMPPSVT